MRHINVGLVQSVIVGIREACNRDADVLVLHGCSEPIADPSRLMIPITKGKADLVQAVPKAKGQPLSKHLLSQALNRKGMAVYQKYLNKDTVLRDIKNHGFSVTTVLFRRLLRTTGMVSRKKCSTWRARTVHGVLFRMT